MKRFLKTLSCPLALCLSGCYLDIQFEGPGHVTSTDGFVDCTEGCRYNTGIGIFTRELNATPAAGYQFLGFATYTTNLWYTGIENHSVTYGAGVRSNLPPSGPVSIGFGVVRWPVDVTAVFWPEGDIRQSLVVHSSICLVDQSSQLTCWGAHKGRFPAEGVSRLVTDSVGAKSSVCAIYSDKLLCRYDQNNNWVIPDTITAPIDAVVLQQSLCVLHATEAGNAVYCATKYGNEVVPVPALSNPTALYVNADRKFCAENEGGSVCW